MSVFRSPLLVFALLFSALASPASAIVTVKLHTTAGDMTFDLYDEDKPVTVANFLRYIRDDRYADSFAHRLPQGFVLQGGGQTYSSANGFGQVSTYDPIVNEYSVGTTYSNIAGTLAMAKVDGDPDSATSQWFLNLADNSTILDGQNGGFTVFGHIVDGDDVLTRFQNFTDYADADGTDLILHQIYDSPYDDLPVYSVADAQFNFLNDLIFTTWTIIGGTKPVITSAATVWAQQDTPFSYQITATGNPTSFAVVSGTLPAGVSLDPDSGLISGTPTDATPATLELTISATSGEDTGSASLTIGYNSPLIADGLTASATQGQPFTFQITATNNPTSYDASGLPDGVTVDTATGLISGIPTVYGSGTVTLYAKNAGGTYSASLALTIAQAATTTTTTTESPVPPTVTMPKKITGSGGKVTLKGSAGAGAVKVEVKAGKGGFKKAKGSPAHWKFPVKGLKPGKYKFRVRVTNADGRFTTKSVTVVIKS